MPAKPLVRLRSLQQEAETLSSLYQATLTWSQEFEQQSFLVSNVRMLSYAQVLNILPGAGNDPHGRRGGPFGPVHRAGPDRAARGTRPVDADRRRHDGRSGLRFLDPLPVLGRPRRPAPQRLRLTRSPSAASGSNLPTMSRPEIPHIAIPVLSIPTRSTRHIRLAASSRSGPLSVTGMTSFHRYDGRAMVTLNLAGQTAASSGRHVLLIDSDRRDRQLTKLVGLSEKKGLTNLVSDSSGWRSHLYDVKHSHLIVLPAGTGSNEAVDDLTVARTLRRILDQVADEFGHVLLDVPPFIQARRGWRSCRSCRGSSSSPNGARHRATWLRPC